MAKKICFSLLLLQFLFSYGQIEEVNPPDYIKSITFKSLTSDLGELPIIRLGEAFYLEFDALVNNEPDFYYKLEHYDFDWTESVLFRPEFLLGIDNFRIVDYTNSFNTFQLYSHYKLSIPNEQTRKLLVSGNYVISIFDENDELVFSRKFMIYENIKSVALNVKRSRNVKIIDSVQTVDIEVSGGIRLNNPLETVKLVLIQNRNLNTAITGLKPQYTIGDKLIYRYTDESAFYGGNEYRFFETKDLRAAAMGVQFTDLKDIFHTYLLAYLQ